MDEASKKGIQKKNREMNRGCYDLNFSQIFTL